MGLTKLWEVIEPNRDIMIDILLHSIHGSNKNEFIESKAWEWRTIAPLMHFPCSNWLLFSIGTITCFSPPPCASFSRFIFKNECFPLILLHILTSLFTSLLLRLVELQGNPFQTRFFTSFWFNFWFWSPLYFQEVRSQINFIPVVHYNSINHRSSFTFCLPHIRQCQNQRSCIRWSFII